MLYIEQRYSQIRPLPSNSIFSFKNSLLRKVKQLHFSLGTFSKIQQDIVLAFMVAYMLVFIDVPASLNFNFPFSFLLLVKSEWNRSLGYFN